MILHIRATSGGGKTTAMRHLLSACGAKPFLHTATRARKVLAYKGYVNLTPMYILGDYSPERSAGGCDTIPKIAQVIELVDKYANRNNGDCIVAFEGLLLAHSWGALGEHVHEKYGDRYINAFLDTTVDECYKRVLKRRAAKGSSNEDPDRIAKIKHNVYADYHRVELCWDRVKARGGRRIKIPNLSAGLRLWEMCVNWADGE